MERAALPRPNKWRSGKRKTPHRFNLERIPERRIPQPLERVPVRFYRPMTTRKSLSPLAATSLERTARDGNAARSSAKERAESAPTWRTYPAPDTRTCRRQPPRPTIYKSGLSPGPTSNEPENGTGNAPLPVPVLPRLIMRSNLPRSTSQKPLSMLILD